MAFDREIAALTIFCEASGEPFQGKVGVAATLINRVRSGRFGRSIAAVCLKRMQYSEWNADQADNANLLRGAETPEHDKVLQDCLDAYDSAMSGNDPTGGATHYFADTIAAPAWAAQGTLTVQIGHHKFYKNVP